MRKSLVYDLPTRFFHWIFAILFVGAFAIAKIADSESSIYPYHMLLGITMASAVILRLYWGVFGSQYAKFSYFSWSPTALFNYFKDLLSAKSARSLGHNPASSWAGIAMMVLSLGLAVTGYMMSQRINKDTVEEVHELFANAFVIIVIAHVAGVIFHTLRHKDAIGLSMVDGKKLEVAGEAGIEKSHAVIGFAFLVLIGGVGSGLYKAYDTSTKSLNLFGTTLQLGETEEEKATEGIRRGKGGEKENHENKEGENSKDKNDKDDDD